MGVGPIMLEWSSLVPARVKNTPRTAVLKSNAGLNSDVLCAPAPHQASDGKRGYEGRDGPFATRFDADNALSRELPGGHLVIGP